MGIVVCNAIHTGDTVGDYLWREECHRRSVEAGRFQEVREMTAGEFWSSSDGWQLSHDTQYLPVGGFFPHRCDLTVQTGLNTVSAATVKQHCYII